MFETLYYIPESGGFLSQNHDFFPTEVIQKALDKFVEEKQYRECQHDIRQPYSWFYPEKQKPGF